MNFVKNDIKIKLVNKLGAVIIIFVVRAEEIPSISPILELKVEAATMEINPEYVKIDIP